jgi:ATP-dependent Zn protease
MKQGQCEATAYHEAGHAVAALVYGLAVRAATIIPAPGVTRSVGHANPSRGIQLDFDDSPRARRRAETSIIVCLAGPAAQRRYSARSSYYGASDHATARRTWPFA